ncbi:transposase [Burkholderia gladioli]|uniref:transposase n=1 Tax=Burkholderia gladioli TaxID=28095 RepID=UPI003A5C3FB1
MKDTVHPVRGSASSPNRHGRASESSKVLIAIERVLSKHQGERDLDLPRVVGAQRSRDETRGKSPTGKRYTNEIRAEAVRQVVELGASVKQVAARLGVSTWSLHRWVRARDVSHPAVNANSEHSSEIQWLRAELLRVTEERDMLEKAAAYFAKQAG